VTQEKQVLPEIKAIQDRWAKPVPRETVEARGRRARRDLKEVREILGRLGLEILAPQDRQALKDLQDHLVQQVQRASMVVQARREARAKQA
jgi:hypothetical protein